VSHIHTSHVPYMYKCHIRYIWDRCICDKHRDKIVLLVGTHDSDDDTWSCVHIEYICVSHINLSHLPYVYECGMYRIFWDAVPRSDVSVDKIVLRVSTHDSDDDAWSYVHMRYMSVTYTYIPCAMYVKVSHNIHMG